MDFKFCLLAGGCPPSCSDRLIIYSRMCDDVIWAIFSNRDLNKKAIMVPWESPFTSNFITQIAQQFLYISKHPFG